MQVTRLVSPMIYLEHSPVGFITKRNVEVTYEKEDRKQTEVYFNNIGVSIHRLQYFSILGFFFFPPFFFFFFFPPHLWYMDQTPTIAVTVLDP